MAQGPHFRAFARRDMALPARVDGADGTQSDARLLNVGLGGACLEMPQVLDVGLVVTLHVTTPVLWDPLVVHSRVVWSRPGDDGPSQVGLRFDHERSKVVRALLELLGTDEFA